MHIYIYNIRRYTYIRYSHRTAISPVTISLAYIILKV